MDGMTTCQPEVDSFLNMEFIDAMKEAMKVGISASDFKEIWMVSERRKQEEELWKRKVEERHWLQDLRDQESEGNTEVRARRLSPATKENRSGAVFTHPKLPTFSAEIASESELNQRVTEPAVIGKENGLPTKADVMQPISEDRNFPPAYEKHNQFKTVLAFSELTVTRIFPDADDDEETTVKTPVGDADSDSDGVYEEIRDVKKVDDDEDDNDENLTPEQRSELLVMINKLSEDQKALKTKLSEYDERLNSLIRKQPSIQRRLTVNARRRCFRQQTKSVMTKDDDRIYAQIEQLYTNFCRINFQKELGTSSSSPSWLPPMRMNDDDIYSNSNSTVTMLLRENSQLQEKIDLLERNASMRNATLQTTKANHTFIESLKFQDLNTCESESTAHPHIASDVHHIESTFEWDIPYYSEKMEMEKCGKRQCTVSDSFEIGHPGYSGRLEIYLNGNGSGHNKCMSLFLRITKGRYDGLLQWPAIFTVKFILINQEDKGNDSLIYGKDDKLFRFEKPSGEADSQSDSWGLVEFVPHKMIGTRKYIKDDSIKVRIVVRKKQ